MKIKDVIKELNQFDQDIELVINVDGKFITPSINRDIVYYKHDFNGCSYTDEAIVMASR